MKKILPLFLALVLVMSLFAPAALADNGGAPSREDMRGHGDIAVPAAGSWLNSYETRYVCSSGGVAAFLFKAPVLDMDLYFDDVLEGTELTVLAKQSDKRGYEFYLVKMADRRVGWICVGQTAEDTALLDSVPELTEGSWLLKMGEGEKNTFAVQFGPKRSATMLRASDGAKLLSGWILSGRRVLLDGKYFIWDGESFVSRDEFQTVQGNIRFTVEPDAEGLFDRLAAK